MARILVATIALALESASPVAAEASAVVIRPQSDAAASVEAGRIDHALYGVLLRRYVDEEGLVDYTGWKAEGAAPLASYLTTMADVEMSELADEAERLAYWINVYNALTLHGMLRFYPTASIRDHVALLWGFNFWKDVKIEVEGKARSLDEIEHKILRLMGEPRIHFAIVCASLSCPRLLSEAYTGEKIEEQLTRNTKRFFADETIGMRIDEGSGTVYLSSILNWFEDDFGGTDRSKLDFAAQYAPSERAREILRRGGLKVKYLEYDWSINDRARRGE